MRSKFCAPERGEGLIERRSLLLINGSQILTDITKKILERAGYSVRCAVGIAGARERLADYLPDGIVMEKDLPDGNGIEYCGELLKAGSIPIMIISNDKENELPALRAGASDFLKKPFDFDIMKARLSVMLGPGGDALPESGVKIRTVSGAAAADTKTASQVRATDTDAMPDEQAQWPDVRDDSEARQYKRQKASIQKRAKYLTVAVACVAFIIIIATILTTNGTINLPDINVPMSKLPVETEGETESLLNLKNSVVFPLVDDITIPVGAANVITMLRNPDGNTCYLSFNIILTETGDVLYSSDPIAPGAHIDEIALAGLLEKGEYAAAVSIKAYAPDDLAFLCDMDVIITITSR